MLASFVGCARHTILLSFPRSSALSEVEWGRNPGLLTAKYANHANPISIFNHQ
jgi:hypothetical protein